MLGLVDFCGGIEYVFMTILMAILKQEWGLDVMELSSLGSAYLLGTLIGGFLCAYVSDVIGR